MTNHSAFGKLCQTEAIHIFWSSVFAVKMSSIISSACSSVILRSLIKDIFAFSVCGVSISLDLYSNFWKRNADEIMYRWRMRHNTIVLFTEAIFNVPRIYCLQGMNEVLKIFFPLCSLLSISIEIFSLLVVAALWIQCLPCWSLKSLLSLSYQPTSLISPLIIFFNYLL